MGKLTVKPLSSSLGAEIEGFDPAVADEDVWHELSGIFDERGLLVFREVELDGPTQHHVVERLYASGEVGNAEEAASAPFGFVSNTEPDGGAPWGRLLFHSDMMWSDLAHQIPSLYAVQAEQPSTPTVFVSTTEAWITLPEELRSQVEGLHVRHESGPQGRGNTDYEDELLQPDWDRLRDTITPLALKHPRTGRTMLYVCEQQTREVVELPKEESDALLDQLFAHLYDPTRLVSHRWQTGDLVVWDNQAVQHGRPYLEGDGPARTLRKIHAPAGLLQRIGAQPVYEAER